MGLQGRAGLQRARYRHHGAQPRSKRFAIVFKAIKKRVGAPRSAFTLDLGDGKFRRLRGRPCVFSRPGTRISPHGHRPQKLAVQAPCSCVHLSGEVFFQRLPRRGYNCAREGRLRFNEECVNFILAVAFAHLT